MFLLRYRAAALAIVGGLTLGACAYDDYGYGGVSVGYGGYYGNDGYYDDPYWSRYSSRPYWGWNNNYYYPGTGYYVYDRYRRPHRWNDYQRRYWLQRRHYWQDRGDRYDRRHEWRDNWRDFREDRREWREDRREWRDDRRDRRRDRRDRRWDRRD